MTKGQEKDIMHKAIRIWGEELQIIMAIEEMSELIKVLTKFLRLKNALDVKKTEVAGMIAEERADVSIMLDQLRIIFGNSGMEMHIRDYKMDRLKKRIEDHERSESTKN